MLDFHQWLKAKKLDESVLGTLGSAAVMGLGYGVTRGLLSGKNGKASGSGDAGTIAALNSKGGVGGGFAAGMGSGLAQHLMKSKPAPKKKQRKI